MSFGVIPTLKKAPNDTVTFSCDCIILFYTVQIYILFNSSGFLYNSKKTMRTKKNTQPVENSKASIVIN